MKARPAGRRLSGFRFRIFFATMVVIAALTLAGVGLTNRHLSKIAENDLQASIDQALAAAAHTREVRQTVLSNICDNLAREPRIHAALEDDALDLLYPSADNELWQLMGTAADSGAGGTPHLKARFYRFLDMDGRLIPPQGSRWAGDLEPAVEARLEVSPLTGSEEVGYVVLTPENAPAEVTEIITVPIVSTETFAPIAALVVGFPFEPGRDMPVDTHHRTGLWLEETLVMPSVSSRNREIIAKTVHDIRQGGSESTIEPTATLDGTLHRVVLRPLNSGSTYPLAHEVFLASTADLVLRQNRLRNQILAGGGILVLAGLALSHLTANRLARPVEALAQASEEEHLQRLRVETALDHTHDELKRAARFSADASHQLKTPVAVMRAGLEELLADGSLPSHLRPEVEALVRQTGRLTSVIDDLLLLSRLDSGHLNLPLRALDLQLLVDSLLDDFSILPEAEHIAVEVVMEEGLLVMGDHGYTALILQNLLENARKYNRPGGRIQIVAERRGPEVNCRLGNTGTAISPTTQTRIFERFHRGASGENVPGYGLGLNLARELARHHGGELRLLYSENDWTEFELTLRAAQVVTRDAEGSA